MRRWCVFALAAIGFVMSGCEPPPCDRALVAGAVELGTNMFAFRLRVEADAVDGWYVGSMQNLSADTDCTIAVYRFFEEPSVSALPVLKAGDVAPPELPGGGVLVEQYYLQAARWERHFSVKLGSNTEHTFALNPEPPHEEWLVGTTCLKAQLDFTLVLSVQACNEDGPAPSQSSGWIERVW